MANEEVTDEQKVSSGGGLASEGEMIEVVELSIEDAISYINSPNCESPVFTVRINSQICLSFANLTIISTMNQFVLSVIWTAMVFIEQKRAFLSLE